MNTECPNPWSTADLISMGISPRAQRLFLEQTLWAMDKITLRPVPRLGDGKTVPSDSGATSCNGCENQPPVTSLDYEGAD